MLAAVPAVTLVATGLLAVGGAGAPSEERHPRYTPTEADNYINYAERRKPVVVEQRPVLG